LKSPQQLPSNMAELVLLRLLSTEICACPVHFHRQCSSLPLHCFGSFLQCCSPIRTKSHGENHAGV